VTSKWQHPGVWAYLLQHPWRVKLSRVLVDPAKVRILSMKWDETYHFGWFFIFSSALAQYFNKLSTAVAVIMVLTSAIFIVIINILFELLLFSKNSSLHLLFLFFFLITVYEIFIWLNPFEIWHRLNLVFFNFREKSTVCSNTLSLLIFKMQ
jgi:hypothetical protein